MTRAYQYRPSDAERSNRLHHFGRVLPMEAPRKSLVKAFMDVWRGW